MVRGLEDISLNEVGKTATFECEVSKKGLKPEWYKNDKPVKRSENYNIVSDGCIHRLVIEKAADEEVGQYKVVFKEQKLQSDAKLTIAGNYKTKYKDKG